MMRKQWTHFLQINSLFLLIFSVLFVSLFSAAYFFYNRNYRLKLSEGVDTIILGNSHPQCAIDDSLLKSTKNLSRAGEPLFYVLPKLRHVASSNDQLKRVILELSDKEFQSALARWMWQPMVIEHCTKAYWAYWPMETHVKLLQKSGVDYLSYLFAGQRKYFLALNQDNQLFFDFLLWGGFKSSKERLIMPNANMSNAKEYASIDSTLVPVEENLNALLGIIDFCNKNNLDLIFLRCPVHPSLHDCFEKSYFEWVSTNLNIKVLDYRSLKIPNDYFKDKEHLNHQGASFFTRLLIQDGICR
jgi:hypothetical protein